ncbi:MAG: hypothetical protein PHN75_16970 [Syntrophales bacterium]|nr:hypothetical protein [Syntrophales bacterium]
MTDKDYLFFCVLWVGLMLALWVIQITIVVIIKELIGHIKELIKAKTE